jgi:hypothetical protein
MVGVAIPSEHVEAVQEAGMSIARSGQIDLQAGRQVAGQEVKGGLLEPLPDYSSPSSLSAAITLSSVSAVSRRNDARGCYGRKEGRRQVRLDRASLPEFHCE